MTFNGSSQNLKATQVVATLDAPIPKGTSVIWCASFLCAWKAMEYDLAGGPILLEGNVPMVASLNEALDPRGWLPGGGLYTATGQVDKGILQTIARDLKERFPAKQPPTFLDLPSDSYVAYSYLEASVKFTLPYFQSREPLVFTDSDGKETPVKSFGIREEDAYAYNQLRAQPRFLFRKFAYGYRAEEFAIDLCASSSPSQVIVAVLGQAPTLAAALGRVESESQEFAGKHSRHTESIEIYESDVLLVPDLCWQIAHHYREMEGKRLVSGPLKGRPLAIAQQDILFRLSRSGADLKSESKLAAPAKSSYFVVDRPFLIVMKKRGAASPYFAMWVANAELLQRW
jgi:hypothetical protein